MDLEQSVPEKSLQNVREPGGYVAGGGISHKRIGMLLQKTI